nr:hypothetical protein CFP56_63342 [Quercus suber]
MALEIPYERRKGLRSALEVLSAGMADLLSTTRLPSIHCQQALFTPCAIVQNRCHSLCGDHSLGLGQGKEKSRRARLGWDVPPCTRLVRRSEPAGHVHGGPCGDGMRTGVISPRASPMTRNCIERVGGKRRNISCRECRDLQMRTSHRTSSRSQSTRWSSRHVRRPAQLVYSNHRDHFRHIDREYKVSSKPWPPIPPPPANADPPALRQSPTSKVPSVHPDLHGPSIRGRSRGLAHKRSRMSRLAFRSLSGARGRNS